VWKKVGDVQRTITTIIYVQSIGRVGTF